MICPHAGFRYSGPTAAYSYRAIQQELARPDSPIRHILVLHPSHHVYLDGCAVSGASVIHTPLGNLTVDDALRNEIMSHKAAGFSTMSRSVDEAEHSGEMQYPFLALVAPHLPVLPVMCGAMRKEEPYGQRLASIVQRDDVLTVVSSDFCHWGARFQYQPTGVGRRPIHEFIEELDRRGMDLIRLQQPGAFAEYLKETRNTICGRHAIAVWMWAAEADLEVDFVRYAQSSAVTSMHESSVSYASAVVVRKQG